MVPWGTWGGFGKGEEGGEGEVGETEALLASVGFEVYFACLNQGE